MQAVFFFLFLIVILCFVPYPVSAEIVFDLEKTAGAVRVKLFDAFTVFRATAVLEEKALKIYTKKDRYIFVGLVEAAVSFLEGGGEESGDIAKTAKKASKAYIPYRAIRFDEISIVAEQGSAENIELTAFAGGLLNILGGAAYALIKKASPETKVSINLSCQNSGNFRAYAKSIISVRPADIIKDIFRKKILRKA